MLPIAEYEPGKKLPPHVSPFYEFSEDGHMKVNRKIHEEDYNLNNTIKTNENNEPIEDFELREMLISKNKKKVLNKLLEEQKRKKKAPKVKK